MILVDTSVWIDHFRKDDRQLAGLLDRGLVMTHPFVIGELSLGNLRDRELILGTLADLPEITVASDFEVSYFIDQNRLFGRGIDYVDVHLLAAVRLTHGTRLWTLDKRLQSVAAQIDLAFAAI